jgi:hypothetical protein
MADNDNGPQELQLRAIHFCNAGKRGHHRKDISWLGGGEGTSLTKPVPGRSTPTRWVCFYADIFWATIDAILDGMLCPDCVSRGIVVPSVIEISTEATEVAEPHTYLAAAE